jgi:hypothetical protein
MEANVIATADDLVRVVSQRGQNINSCKTRDDLSLLTKRFRNALKKSVAGIIEAGQVLIEAKGRIEHGDFTDWEQKRLTARCWLPSPVCVIRGSFSPLQVRLP